MQTVWMQAHMVFCRHMQLHYHFIIIPKFTFYVIHFFPSRATVGKADTNMLPSKANAYHYVQYLPFFAFDIRQME